jgi:hypothetical protein
MKLINKLEKFKLAHPKGLMSMLELETMKGTSRHKGERKRSRERLYKKKIKEMTTAMKVVTKKISAKNKTLCQKSASKYWTLTKHSPHLNPIEKAEISNIIK